MTMTTDAQLLKDEHGNRIVVEGKRTVAEMNEDTELLTNLGLLPVGERRFRPEVERTFFATERLTQTA
jgi:hypothetical protein